MAAHRQGIKEVVVPKDNEKDLPDIPENIRNEMKLTLRRVHGRSSQDSARARGAASAARAGGCRGETRPVTEDVH